MADLDFDAIRARCDAATPGPWWVTEDLDTDDAAIGVAAGWDLEEYTSVVVVTPGSATFDIGEPTDRLADATFIAACREDVPALLAAYDDLAGRIAAAQADQAQLHALIDEIEARQARTAEQLANLERATGRRGNGI
jgi:hypothetical protein